MASGTVWYWDLNNVIENKFLFISWLCFLLLKLAFRLPAIGNFFHSLCLDHMSRLNQSLCPGQISWSDWLRSWVLWSSRGVRELGVELSLKVIGREWWRILLSEGKWGYTSQENWELIEDITSYRWPWPVLLLSRASVQEDFLMTFRLCCVYDLGL